MVENFLIGLLASMIVGVLLWLLLPRGVVVTRNNFTTDSWGDPLPDTWTLRNGSALPVRIVSVELVGSTTYVDGEARREQLGPADLASDRFKGRIDSDVSGGEVLAACSNWRDVELVPGDALLVTMPNLHQLTVRYRRAGWSGVLERRSVQIYGVA